MVTVLLLPCTNDSHSPFGALRREVVQHDTVWYVGCQCLADLVLVAGLNLDAQIFALLLAIGLSARERCGDTAREVHVVVLEQNHIKETDAVVHAAADEHCLFLQVTQTWGGLAGVQHVATCTLDERLVAVRRGRYTRHALHDIEHGALNLQETELLAIDTKGNIAWLDMRAVFDELLHAALRVEIGDNLFGYFDTSNDTFFFYNQLLASHLCLGDTTERCMVAITNVFFEPDGNEFL